MVQVPIHNGPNDVQLFEALRLWEYANPPHTMFNINGRKAFDCIVKSIKKYAIKKGDWELSLLVREGFLPKTFKKKTKSIELNAHVVVKAFYSTETFTGYIAEK